MEALVRGVVKDIGYDDPAIGFDSETCAVMVAWASSPPTSPWAWTNRPATNKAPATKA